MHSRYYGAALALLTLPGLRPAQAQTQPTPPAATPTRPDAAAILQEGLALREKEQYAEAAARYQLVTPGDSAYAQAQVQLAASLIGAKKYDEAVAAAQRALAAEPFSAETYIALAATKA